MKTQKSRKKLPYAFITASILPTCILTGLFIIAPTVQVFLLSFTDSTGISNQYQFVGIENYTYMMKDKLFLQALGNSLKLMLVVPIVTITFALILAFILTQSKLKEKAFYRMIFFFPSIVSLTVIGIIFSFMFHPTMGTINQILGTAIPWLGNSKTALWCIAATLIWQSTGYYMVMHIAAIDGISPAIYESATIDGASQFNKMIFIVLPLLRNIIGVTFILSLSGTMVLSYILSDIMTSGGPSGSSTVLLQYMYSQAFSNSNFGYAMAIAAFIMFLSIILSLISKKITEEKE